MTRNVVRLILAGVLVAASVAPSHAAKIIRYGNGRTAGAARAQLRAERAQMRGHHGARTAAQSDIPPPPKH